MRHITTTTTVAALALAAATLGACSSVPDSRSDAATAYCAELRTDEAWFDSMRGDDPDLGRLEVAFSRIHSLADAAPPAVGEAWATFDDAATTLQDAFDDAGIDPADLEAMQDGKIPAGVDLDALAAMAPKMRAFEGPELDRAAAQIASHARSECGIDLPAP